MLRSIGPAINLQKSKEKKNFSSGFLRFLYWASPTFGIYGTFLLPLMLVKTTGKMEKLFPDIRIYARGIAGFTEQRIRAH